MKGESTVFTPAQPADRSAAAPRSVEFSTAPKNGEKIPAEMFGAYLRAEAKMARETQRYARSFFDRIVSASRVLDRAAGPVTPEHRAELIKVVTQSLKEVVAEGFTEVEFPDMSIYPEG
jgi:hypothetical protein